jgi:hypothetical protein
VIARWRIAELLLIAALAWEGEQAARFNVL